MVATAPAPDSLTPRRRSFDRATIVTGLVLLVPIVVIAAGAWRLALHVRRRVHQPAGRPRGLAGHGPVFNPGERVEASTSPLWIAFLVVGDVLLPLRLEWVAVLLGISLTVLGLGLTIFGAIRLSPSPSVEPRTWWQPVGALLVAVLAPMWKFASSGLENGLSFAWLGGCFAVLAVWSAGDRRLRYPAAVLLGLGPLVRPEIGLFTAGLPRHRARGAVAATTRGPAASRFWAPRSRSRSRTRSSAWATTRAWCPTRRSRRRRVAPYWSSGWHYLRQATEPYVLWIPLALLAVACVPPALLDLHRHQRRRSLLLVIVLVITAFVDAIYIVRVGGDFMQSAPPPPRAVRARRPGRGRALSARLRGRAASRAVGVHRAGLVALARRLTGDVRSCYQEPRHGGRRSGTGRAGAR